MPNDISIPLVLGWNRNVKLRENQNENPIYHVLREDSDKILNFIMSNDEGAILITGKRGVGKTNLVFSCINLAISLQKKKNIKFEPIYLNVSNFDLLYDKAASKSRNNTLLTSKMILIQSLIRRLYQDLEPVLKKEGESVGNDTYEKLKGLYDRAVAKEVSETINTSHIHIDSDFREKTAKKSVSLDSKNIFLFLCAIVSILIVNSTEISILAKILASITSLGIPLFLIKYSLDVENRRIDSENNQDKKEKYYEYDFNIHTLEYEFQSNS